MKQVARWYSDRLGQEVTTARWGHHGTPVLLFPTAGGDAEEIERFHMIDACSELVEAGRVKIYSCDSVAGRALLVRERSSRHCSWMQRQFHEFIYHELVPAIRVDCHTPDIQVISAGSSIGAFHAVAMLCRYPDAFAKAIGMSGTYDLQRFFDGPVSEDFYQSSPLHYLPKMSDQELEAVRSRFILLTSGEGRAEDIGESWRMAHVLGSRGIPNRVDSWGTDWPHDWPTWRHMLPRYLEELA